MVTCLRSWSGFLVDTKTLGPAALSVSLIIWIGLCPHPSQAVTPAVQDLRVDRLDTLAQEVLQSVPSLREELDTKLYQELRRELPQTTVGGVKYYFVEGDLRVTEDELLLYAAKLNQQYAVWRQLQSAPEAVRQLLLDRNRAELVAEMERDKIVRWKPSAEVSYCVMRRSFGSGSDAEQRYQSVVSELKAAAQAWMDVPGAAVPRFVHRSDLDSSPSSSTPDGVTFAVWAIDLPGNVIASAFFPNDPQANWNVLVDLEAYFGEDLLFDRVGVLRHELGHVLGFRHEHPRSEAPLVCKTPEVFDDQIIPLGEYDPVSVMHYFCRGFNNPAQEELNLQRRQLLLSEVDRQGVRLVYPPIGEPSGFEFLEFDPNRQSTGLAHLAQSESVPRVQPSSTSSANPNERNAEGVLQGNWVEPQDTAAAINDPDHYAWRLFVALNWPADLERREADSARGLGEHAPTVWESWKFSSGALDEVFLATGGDPGPWLGAERAAARPRSLEDFEALPFQQQFQRSPDGGHAGFDPSTSARSRNENHMNRAAYEFVRLHELYNVEGQERLFQKAEDVFAKARAENRAVQPHEYKLHFPVGAKEVKAQWREIAEADKPKYHWTEFVDDAGTAHLYGLTALHITTKDVPNWFWATFEHADNPKREGAEAWQLPSVDSASGPEGFPAGLGIEGTRWANYRLRGTQVEFVDSLGQATVLANSQIEEGFQHSSSCITCHARATIGARVGTAQSANRLSIFRSVHPQADKTRITVGNVGVLPEERFVTRTFTDEVTGRLDYLQLDFVWSLMRARRAVGATGPSEVSFREHIRPLFRERDISAMRNVFDLSAHRDVATNAEAIYSRLKDGSMPCDVPWSQANVELFRKWIDGGMNE